METATPIVKPQLPDLYSPANILKIEKAVNQKVCEKTLNLAQKYIERDEPVSSFNKNFMNEMIRADPEKFRSTLIQENGMSVGINSQTLYIQACKYFTQSDEDGYRAGLAAIEQVAKRVMDMVFMGQCTLAKVQAARDLMLQAGWVEEKQTSFLDRAQ
jgi:hypothetical protein